MIKHFFSILLLFPLLIFGQSLSEPKQRAINNYIQLANHLTNESQSVGPSLVRYYSEMIAYRKNSSRPIPDYTCRLDAKPYYYEEAKKSSAALGAAGSGLVAASEAMRNSFQKIDETCKAIEIYFRLKDYETDQFKRFEELVAALEDNIKTYGDKVKAVQLESEKLYSTWQPYNPNNAYHKADRLMRNQLAFEKGLLDAWTFNLTESVHTGWPSEKAQQHILDGTKKIDILKQAGATLKYPASSMYKSFIESAEALHESKRSGVDSYTFEKQQSDKHSNDLYVGMTNYYNNAENSFHHNFINQSVVDGFRGIYCLDFVPLFQVRTSSKEIKFEVTPFLDKPFSEFTITPATTTMAPAVFASLSNYVDLMNEGMRQIANMMNAIRNLNSDASHGKARMKMGKRVSIDYYYKDFELPVTLYQQTIDQSKSLPKNYQKPLREQADALYSILNELNQWNSLLLRETASEQLAKDSLDHVYSIVTRYKDLIQFFDYRKEHLNNHVRAIVESYRPTNPKNAWLVSGNAMLALMEEERKELFKSKRFFEGDASAKASTETMRKLARDLILNEYTNLAGLEKLGSSNGNDPYTPYENMATHTAFFAESLEKANQGEALSSYYKHPYNQLIYLYNQTLAYQYNKFAELSKVPLLEIPTQMEWFEIKPPERPSLPKPVEPVEPTTVLEYTPEVSQPEITQPEITKPEVQNKKESTASAKRKKKKEVVTDSNPPTSGVVHDTVRITDIIRIETIRQDTVFVSKVDTVFVGGIPGNNLSMDGYATNNMVLLLDVSGSMNSEEKLPLLKKSVLLLLKIMRAEDEVSIITYSGKAKVELPPTSFKQEAKIKKVIDQLKSAGATDANSGIILAYQTADKNYIRGGNNRIILATDGEFQIGSKTLELVKKFTAQDIFITVFNFGKSSQSAKSLQQLAASGKGNYEYITRQNVDAKFISEVKAKKKK